MTSRALEIERLARGQCSRCGKKNKRDTQVCRTCQQSINKTLKANRHANRARGLCRCGGKPYDRFSQCLSCLEKGRSKRKVRK